MLVIDATIPIRVVLGACVRSLIVKYGAVVDLFAPATAWAEAWEHLPFILRKRGVPVEAGVLLLNSREEIIQPVDFETYGSFELAARTRLASRGPDDWPVLAAALALRSPIRTEDSDFFGAGVATWTTDRVELFLGAAGEPEYVARCRRGRPDICRPVRVVSLPNRVDLVTIPHLKPDADSRGLISQIAVWGSAEGAAEKTKRRPAVRSKRGQNGRSRGRFEAAANQCCRD